VLAGARSLQGREESGAGQATAPRTGPRAAPGPGPPVRTGSPDLLRRGGSCRPGAWPRTGGRGVDRVPRRHPRRGAGSDGASRAAARSRKPASRPTEPGGLAKQTERLISGRL